MTTTCSQFLNYIDVNNKDIYESNMEKASTEIQKECVNRSNIQILFSLGSNHWVLFTIVPSQRIIYHWVPFGCKHSQHFTINLMENLNYDKNEDWTMNNVRSVVKSKIQTDITSCGIFIIEYSLLVVNIEKDNDKTLFNKVEYVAMNSMKQIRNDQYFIVKRVYESITRNEIDCNGLIIHMDQEEHISEHTILKIERFIHDEKRKQNMLVKDRKRKNEESSNESLEENTIRLKKSKIRIIDDRRSKSFEENKIRLNKDKKEKRKSNNVQRSY